MPIPLLRKASEETGKSIPELESLWEKAKEKASGEGHSEDWGYVTSIFKGLAGFAESYSVTLVDEQFGQPAFDFDNAPKTETKIQNGMVKISNVPMFSVNNHKKTFNYETGEVEPVEITLQDINTMVTNFKRKKTQLGYLPPVERDHKCFGPAIGKVDNLFEKSGWLFGDIVDMPIEAFCELKKDGYAYRSIVYDGDNQELFNLAMLGSAPPSIKMPPLAFSEAKSNMKVIISEIPFTQENEMSMYEKVVEGFKGFAKQFFSEAEDTGTAKRISQREIDPKMIAAGTEVEKKEHPWLTDEQAQQVAIDHLTSDAKAYDEEEDDEADENDGKEDKNGEPEEQDKENEMDEKEKNEYQAKIDALEAQVNSLKAEVVTLTAKENDLAFSNELNEIAKGQVVDVKAYSELGLQMPPDMRTKLLETIKATAPKLPTMEFSKSAPAAPEPSGKGGDVDAIYAYAKANNITYGKAMAELTKQGKIHVSLVEKKLFGK